MSSNNQFGLLKEKRFGPFFWTQFLGAFNDNVFKNALVILIAFGGLSGTFDSDFLVNLCAGLFILPFFLFSATSGQIADKYEKSQLIRGIKLAEVFIMICGAIGFITGSLWLLILMLFLMGAQSAVFGPVKYGILPQHLREEEYVGGNGLIEMGTFLAILLGTMAGGILISFKAGAWLVSGTVIFIAILGYIASRGIPVAPAAEPTLKINWEPISETWRNLKFMKGNRTVFLSILGISWFWFYGAIFLAQLPNYSKNTLGGNEQVVSVLLTLFSLGIGVGSLLCERMSGRKVEIGLVPFGSIGLTLFGIDLFLAKSGGASGPLQTVSVFLADPGNWRVMFDLVMIGLFGGFFIVPLYSLVLQRSEPTHRSRIIAGNNILNALFMVVSSIVAILLLQAGLTIPQLFLVTALWSAAVSIYIYTLVPEFLMRFLVWIWIHLMYRIDKQGLDLIPEEGPAVLACNHVSFVDALVIGGCVRRPVRFVMYYKIYNLPIMNFIFRTARAIPIAGSKEDPAMFERANAEIDAALKAGDVICIFPEGGLTLNGDMTEFKKGIEHIVDRNPVPVVPMALRGLWGSFFSRKDGGAVLKFPRRFWSKIGLTIGAPLQPSLVTAGGLQEIVTGLRGEWK